MERLAGSAAIVTGGSKGIGRSIAGALAAQGADCMLAARTEPALEQAAAEISAETGSRVETSTGDLREPAACEALVARTLERFGRIDILVNCAGATKAGRFLDLDDDDWVDGFALKLHAAVRLTRLCWPHLAESHGTVINVVGGLARTPAPDVLIAGAVNAAFANFSKGLAKLGMQDDVNVNVIHPGQTVTDRLRTLFQTRAEAAGVDVEEFERSVVEKQGLRRLGRPDDIAALAVFLCLPEARHIQGVAISVDGGGTPGIA